jgi:hypothetical protein
VLAGAGVRRTASRPIRFPCLMALERRRAPRRHAEAQCPGPPRDQEASCAQRSTRSPTRVTEKFPAESSLATNRPRVRNSPGSSVSGLLNQLQGPVAVNWKLVSAFNVKWPGPPMLTVMLSDVNRFVKVC